MHQNEITDINLGSTLSRAFATIKQNLPVFLGLAAIAILPAMILEIIAPSLSGVTGFLDRILGLLVQGAMAYAVFQSMRGNSVSIQSSFSATSPRFVTIFIASILIGFGTLLGLVALIIPGVILAMMWSVTIPACVVENLGAVDSMKRSAALTKGYRGKIFLLYLVVGLILCAIMAPIVFIAAALGSEVLITIIISLAMIIPIALVNVITAIIYYDLRVITEGITIESIASVFE